MASKKPKEGGMTGTVDQWPRWEGPPETRPPGYLPAQDDPAIDRDAAGENLADPDKTDFGDANLARGEVSAERQTRIARRAYELWEEEGRPDGCHERHWHKAAAEIDGGR